MDLPDIPFGVSTHDQVFLSQERRQTQRVIVKGSEDLAEITPDYILHLNQDDGTGDEFMAFIFGLHDPFDPDVNRLLLG